MRRSLPRVRIVAVLVVAALVAVAAALVWQTLLIQHLQTKGRLQDGEIVVLEKAILAMRQEMSALDDVGNQVNGLSGIPDRVATLEGEVLTLCQHLQEVSQQTIGSYYLCSR